MELCLDVTLCWACPSCGLGGLQHFAILLKYIIHVAIPDIPGWVAEEMAKLEYRRREAFKVWLYHSLKDLRPRRGLLLAALLGHISILVSLCALWSLGVRCLKLYTSAPEQQDNCMCLTMFVWVVLYHIGGTCLDGVSDKCSQQTEKFNYEQKSAFLVQTSPKPLVCVNSHGTQLSQS